MGYGDQHYKIQVKDPRTGEAITSGCLVFIYSAGTKTLATLYKSDNRIALANPITRAQFATDTLLDFYCTDTSVDIFLNDDKGNVSFLASVTPNDRNITLSREGVGKCLIFPMVFNAGATETDTGLDLPVNTIVKNALVEVITVDATETVDIGLLSSETAGDADGFIVAASVASAGFVKPWTTTTGSNETYINTSITGALINKGSTGTDAANDFGQAGGFGHIVSGSNAKSITYTPSTSDTFAGYGYVYFQHIR